MKRYTLLLFITFMLVIILIGGTTYLAGYADEPEEDKAEQSLTVYTTLPTENLAVLAADYEKAHKVKVHFVPLTEKELFIRMKENSKSLKDKGDLVLADREILQQAAVDGKFVKYVSEQSDLVPKKFKDENAFWVGTWYDPIVFCANRDYLKTLPRIPTTWNDLADFHNVRIGITDFLAADASSNLLFTLIAQYDENQVFTMLRKLHPKVIQYSKYLSTPVRMAGMGEVDISIAVQSETLRYINEGFPLVIIYPTDGTAYKLTGAGILKGTSNREAAKKFMDWLLGDEVQLVLQKNSFFFVPTNHATIAYKSFSGKNLVLFDNVTNLSAQQKHAVLDRWVKNIRLK
ncbi:MAG: extracellular solute-binding protein [Selenomonadaceae bacterium]